LIAKVILTSPFDGLTSPFVCGRTSSAALSAALARAHHIIGLRDKIPANCLLTMLAQGG
jgi:hypothetical protein